MRKERIDCFYFQAAGKRTCGNYCPRIYGSSLFLREKQRKPAPRRGVVSEFITRLELWETTQREVPSARGSASGLHVLYASSGVQQRHLSCRRVSLLLQLPGGNPSTFPFLFLTKVLLKNPLFAALTNQRLNSTGWTAELLANFLYNGPLDERPAGMPPYDWRDVYNTTTRVLKLLSNFLGVSSQDEIPDETSTSSLSSSLVLPLTHNRNPEVR